MLGLLTTLNKMAAGSIIFGLARRPRSYSNRLVLDNMADCEVLEQFWLLRVHIKWLVDELEEELERDTVRSCPLSLETQVNVVLLLLFAWGIVVSFTCLSSKRDSHCTLLLPRNGFL